MRHRCHKKRDVSHSDNYCTIQNHIFLRIRGNPAVGRGPVHRRDCHEHEHEPAADVHGRGDERVVGGGAAFQVQDVAEAEESEHAVQTTLIHCFHLYCK